MTSDAPLSRLSFSSSALTLGALSNMAREGELVLDPSYQRASVWTDDQRMALVRSILSGIPIGAVFLNVRPDPTEPYRVVDGRQRIEAIRDFVGGSIRFPAAWIEPSQLEGSADDDGLVCFRDLSTPLQRVLRMSSKVSAYETRLETEEQEAELFRLINFTGTPMGQASA